MRKLKRKNIKLMTEKLHDMQKIMRDYEVNQKNKVRNKSFIYGLNKKSGANHSPVWICFFDLEAV